MDRAAAIEMRDFLVDLHFQPGSQIVADAARRFGKSPHSIRYHLRKLLAEGVLVAEGNTKARRYTLPVMTLASGEVLIQPETQDDDLWRTVVRPALDANEANKAVISAMRHGCTEMINNVLDHSGSAVFQYSLEMDPRSFSLIIRDKGIGIFEKIMRDCKLNDRRQALLELSKGKLTSDPTRHSGEGIFFTSRIFDRFYLMSLDLTLIRTRDGENWLLDTEKNEDGMPGTSVRMEIKRDSSINIQSVFKKFEDDDSRFAKTHVPVVLAKIGEDELVSRSQARRLMARVENFEEVMLDFADVSSIGQAFADEVFRVWVAEHPETTLRAVHASPDVRRMISRAQHTEQAPAERRD